MTTPGIPVSRLVSVAINLAATASQGQDLSNILILGTSSVIDTVERMRSYSSLTAVATDFGTTAEEYLAALLWFEQVPQPTNLYIGRWASAATAGRIVGGVVSAANQALATWTAITNGGFVIQSHGITLAVSGLNFSAATSLNGVASIIQAALTPTFAGMTVVWSSTYQNFVIKTGSTGAAETMSFLFVSGAVGSLTFGGQPANNDTLTLSSYVITFVTGTPAAGQVQIGGSLAATMTNLVTFINANAAGDVNLARFAAYSDGTSKVYLRSTVAGTAGNSYTMAKSSANITLSGATMAGGTASDIAVLLAMLSTSSGAYTVQGQAAETAVTATTLMDSRFGNKWYAMVCPSGTDSDHLAIAALLEGTTTKHVYGITTSEAGVLSTVDTSNIAYQLKALSYKKTTVQYSSTNAYAVVSMLARILTTDYNANNSTITLAYKTEPGITTEGMTTSQLDALQNNNCNVVVNFSNDVGILAPIVVMSSGDPVDTILGLDWFAVTLQTALFNLLYTSTTKIPQTDAGNAVVAAQIAAVCEQAVNNGLVGPGIWTQGGFGSLKTNQPLPRGYYVYQPPIATQSAASRALRESVAFQVALCLAGSIEFVNVSVTVNR